MDYDFLTQLSNAPSLRTFLDEIVILLGILLVNEIKKKKKFSTIPKAYFDGLHSILLVTMPTIAFFNALTEAHFPVYFSILVFLIVFVGWYCYLLIKYKKIPITLTVMFIAFLSFVIFLFTILYFIFR